MARQRLPINLANMQAIIDVEEKNYTGGITDFLSYCCDIYNNKYNPSKPVPGYTLYNRFKAGEIKTSFVKSSKKLSPEHKEKLHSGVKSGRKSRANTDPRHEEYLRREMSERPKLAEKVLGGSMAAAIKAKCLDCCCGDTKEIKHCTSYGCPLFNFRPYKEN